MNDADPPDSPLRILVDDRQDRPVDSGGLVDLAEAVLRGEGLMQAELSVSFVTSAEIEELHVRYLGEPGPTDVLSFPLDERVDGVRLLGDVVICPEVAAANVSSSRAPAHTVDDELRLLMAHGILHLLGHDHEEGTQRDAMWAKQERYSGVRVP
jgi:probable rRNA maturation factor